MSDLPLLDDRQIVALRGPKNHVRADQPYAFLVEQEASAAGTVDDVATIFLTNAECPFRCLMCDLWKNTTDSPVPVGSIVQQIDYALARLPPAQHVKLYNSGNFFDARAIPPEEWIEIAERTRSFETVIVENHPRLVSPRCGEFRELLAGQLEVAMGLETVHPTALARLNKRMTLDDFAHATEWLLANDITVRAFILIQPPFVAAAEAVDWAMRSIEYAFSLGVGVCSLIPTRARNGAMELLQSQGLFLPPASRVLETVLAQGIALGRGRVFLDLWEIERSLSCIHCAAARRERLHRMNLHQCVLPAIACVCQESCDC